MLIIKRLMFSLRTLLGNHPKLFFAFYGIKKRNRNLFVDNKTELVISAYPRTANTFFVVALQHIQKKPISIAHHLHVPALAMQGIKKNIPVIVLIRNPKQAIVSLVIREKHISLKQAIRAYIKFYEPLLNCQNKILVVDFHRIVNDFSSIINNINSKFNLELDNYSEEEPIDNDLIFLKIEEINKRFNNDKLIESMVSRPSQSREKLTRHYLHLIEKEEYKKSLEKCVSVYESLI